MKKLIWLWLPYMIVILLIGAVPQRSAALAQDAQTPSPPDEALVKILLQNTYATSMIFKGSNQNWDCRMTILEKLTKEDNQPDNMPKINFILSPNFTWEINLIRMFKYMIHVNYITASKLSNFF